MKQFIIILTTLILFIPITISKLFGIHWCIEETAALLSTLPFFGLFYNKLHGYYLKYFPGHFDNCHKEKCEEELQNNHINNDAYYK